MPNSMHRLPLLRFVLCAVLLLSVAGCDTLFGTKDDETTREIKEAGRIDPSLLTEVGYVPLAPFYTRGGNGQTFQNPRDVYVGYDRFLYVVDDAGLHVLDLAGRPQAFIAIPGGGTSVIQDRRFHLYVTARRDTTVGGATWNLPVVYRYANVTTGNPTIADIIWHPFDDRSRLLNRPDPRDTDEQVEFTSVAILPDNQIYVSRRGPLNPLNSPVAPHNGIMLFDENGLNLNAHLPLHPLNPSLISAVNPVDVMTFVHPPQRTSYGDEVAALRFMVAQEPLPGMNMAYPVVALRPELDPNGIQYARANTTLIQPAVIADPERGDGFLFEEFKFSRPADLAYAADATGYIYVLDAGKDSLFVFTSGGIEGVTPPAGAASTKPSVVSFGGTGDGAMQFSNPQGVAYFNRIVYVADTGNNRISRFRLNTDFE